MSHVSELDNFFNPRTLAIIGATNTPGFGYGIPLFLQQHGHQDKLRLVNPRGGTMHGMPVYKSVSDVDGPLDLAVMIVPARKVPEVMEQAGQKGIGHVIIESAGFGETGPQGLELHKRAHSIAKKYGIRVIGPNCVGVVNTAGRFATVEVIDEALKPGPVSIIAQSGVFGNILLDGLFEKGVYLSKAITLGNRMDVDECDLLQYLKDDPATEVIMMYLEGAADGPRLRKVLKQVSAEKPVLILKSGRSEAGKAATASHTGSLSGKDELYQGLFSQTNAVRARTLDELVDCALAFSKTPLPAGDRIGIVTSSGSLGALSIDTCIDTGLKPAVLSEQTRTAVKMNAPAWMNVRNPLDVGPSNLFSTALSAMMADPGVDLIIAIAVMPYAVAHEFEKRGVGPDMWIGNIKKLSEQFSKKPLMMVAVGHSNWVKMIREIAGDKVPVITSPEAAVRAAAAMVGYSKRL